MMEDAIKDGDRDDRTSEDLSPFSDGTVGGDEDQALLIASGGELEEEMGGVGLEGEIAEFVDDQQPGSG